MTRTASTTAPVLTSVERASFGQSTTTMRHARTGPDPFDPDVTTRVLTLMLAQDWSFLLLVGKIMQFSIYESYCQAISTDSLLAIGYKPFSLTVSNMTHSFTDGPQAPIFGALSFWTPHTSSWTSVVATRSLNQIRFGSAPQKCPNRDRWLLATGSGGKTHYIGFLSLLVGAVRINVSYAPPWERHSVLYFSSRVANQDSGKHGPITSPPFGSR
jgi:hypothetical protein